MRPVTVLSSLSAVYFFTLLQKRWIHQHSWVLFIRIWAQTPHNSTVTDSFSLKVYVCVWGEAVSRECYYQGEDSRTRSHQHGSACSVNPDSSDVALSSAKGHGFVRASLPGDRRAEWWWQSGKQEHLVSKSLWIWPLKVGILGSSITVLRITVEKVNQIRNGTMVLYLEHVLY